MSNQQCTKDFSDHVRLVQRTTLTDIALNLDREGQGRKKHLIVTLPQSLNPAG